VTWSRYFVAFFSVGFASVGRIGYSIDIFNPT
jgi:hypothetical protein